MITNGEKYACESCIRGHRVAQCQHTDRPLQHVGKKGRPVSQCNHCRTLRTSRSVHTKCKCGSTSRQITLKLFGEDRCLCCEGGDCTCAYKTGQKHCGSSTSSPSVISGEKSPEISESAGISPHLAYAKPLWTIDPDNPAGDGTPFVPSSVAPSRRPEYATPFMTIAPDSQDSRDSESPFALSPHPEYATPFITIAPDVPVRVGPYSGFISHDLNGEHTPPVSFASGGPVHDEDPRTPPDNATHLTTPQTPDWLGALDSVLGPMPDEPAKFLMPEFDDPSVSMDSSHLAHIWDDLPLPEQLEEQPENLDEVLAFDTDLPAILLEHGDHLQSFEHGS